MGGQDEKENFLAVVVPLAGNNQYLDRAEARSHGGHGA
jgi:hypothetical protein